MMNGVSIILSVITFWLVLGGAFQLLDIKDENTLNVTEDDSSLLKDILDIFTFNITGMPQSFRWGLTIFMSFALSLGIYVLLPFTGQ